MKMIKVLIIMGVFTLVMNMGVNVSQAKITKIYNDYSGTKMLSIESISTTPFFDSISFNKNIVDNDTFYILTVSSQKVNNEWIFFENAELEIVSDNGSETICTLMNDEKNKHNILPTQICTAASYSISNDFVKELMNTKKAIIHIHFENSPDVNFVIPDTTLAEWKHIITIERTKNE